MRSLLYSTFFPVPIAMSEEDKAKMEARRKRFAPPSTEENRVEDGGGGGAVDGVSTI